MTPPPCPCTICLPASPIFRGFAALLPKVSGYALVRKRRLVALSAHLDFSQPDIETQDNVLNKILWEAVKSTTYHSMSKDDDD